MELIQDEMCCRSMRCNLVEVLEGEEAVIQFVKDRINVVLSKKELYKHTYTMYGLDITNRQMWYKETKMTILYAEYLTLLVKIDNRTNGK